MGMTAALDSAGEGAAGARWCRGPAARRPSERLMRAPPEIRNLAH
jgi:hypothetical protein